AEHLEEALQSRGVVIFTRGSRDHGFSITAGALVTDESLDGLSFEPDKRLLEMLDDSGENCLQEAAESGAPKQDDTLVAPIRAKDEVVGFICVGGSRTNAEYDAEDMKFLDAVVDQLGSGINNLRLQEQEHELQEARKIQQRLLPKGFPQITGY